MTSSPQPQPDGVQPPVSPEVERFHRRLFAWGFVAQVFSSATNFALSVIAGRLLGPSGLGVVVIGFGAYQLVAGLQRAIVIQPLIADAAPRQETERHRLAESGLTVVAIFTTVATIALLALGLALRGQFGRALLIFAPWLVFAVVQEFWKAILFQENRGAAAALSDCIRFSIVALTIPLALVWSHDYVVVAVWGMGAVAGLIVGLVSLPARPERLRPAVADWRQRAWVLGRWLGAREIIFQSLTYSTLLLLAIILGAEGLGGLRAAEALFSPLSLIAAAFVLPALPALSRAAASSYARALRVAFGIFFVAVALALSYMVGMALFGSWLLVHLYGGSFSPFTSLVWPMAVAQVVSAAGLSFNLLLLADKRGRASLVAGTIGSAATLTFATACALGYGVEGAAWGMAAGSAAGSVAVIYPALRRGQVKPADHASPRRARRNT